MPNYDFKLLSSSDFEELTRDLIQEELGIRLECFKTGRDNGIDFRHSKYINNELIVQCKHYAETGVKGLISKIKNEELKKIRIIKPKRYILATSVGLTPKNKNSLFETLQPFCKNRSDIYGRNDINNLLNKYPEIEKKNFKLWLTSTAVLEKVINSPIYNRSEAELSEIKKSLKLYVKNDSFQKALDVLDEHNYCIISGIPGIGKTMLGNMLMIRFLEDDYQIFKVSSDIEEAFKMLKHTEKQLFYYDDFLGQTSLKAKLAKNEENRLLRFIEAIKRSKHSIFILTTREYILNQALTIYEKLSMINFNISKCIIDLESYTRYQKANVLFNHLYFSRLPKEFKTSILRNKSYLKIIDHKNYNPRIIEFMANFSKDQNIKSDNFVNIFYKNLDNPKNIWEHAFQYQLKTSSRLILLIMATLPRETLISDLEKCFLGLLKKYSHIFNIAFDKNDFKNSLKELEGNFIKITKYEGEINKRSIIAVSYHNPSIRDFINNYLNDNPDEIELILSVGNYFCQLEGLWSDYNNKSGKEIKLILKNISKIVADFILRTLSSSECRLINYSYHGMGLAPCFFGKRILFSLQVAYELDEKYSKYLIDHLLKILIKRITERDIEKEYLLEVLDFLKENSFKYINENELVEISSKYLYDSIETIEEIKYFIELKSAFPNIVENFNFNECKKLFNELYKIDADCYLTDVDEPQSIVMFIDELQELSDYFNVNVDYERNELLERVDELERNEPDYSSEYKQWSGDTVSNQSDEAIINLFDTLIE